MNSTSSASLAETTNTPTGAPEAKSSAGKSYAGTAPVMGSVTGRGAASGTQWNPLGTNSEAAALRNTTVLPQVHSDGPAVQILPRTQTRYEHLKRLGSGAMGEVNLARDNDIGRNVAVKQLINRAQKPDGIVRFIEEIHTIGRLEHPNIVPIHDVGIDEQGQLFFVMKHIDGETLESIIAKLDAGDSEYLERYSIEYRVEIFLGLLRGLQFAHAQGVIHRDIKPAKRVCSRFVIGAQPDKKREQMQRELFTHLSRIPIRKACPAVCF